MMQYNKITALYSRLSVGDEDRAGGERHVAFCSEDPKGKARNPKCNSSHTIDADLLMQTVAEVLRKIANYSISNRTEFEALVKNSLFMQQTGKVKKQQKHIPQITARLEQIDKGSNKLYEDIALSRIEQDRYEQMSQKYSEEYSERKTLNCKNKERLDNSTIPPLVFWGCYQYDKSRLVNYCFLATI